VFSDLEFQKTLNEARHYYELGRYEQALAKLDHLLSISPNDGYILYLRAGCLFYLDRYDEAIDYCNQALTNGFSVTECSYLLGQILMATNRYAEAEECFLAALREDPQRADVMAAYGYLMLKTGYDKKARKLLEEAISVDPSDEVVLHYKFFYHLAKDKRGDQIEVLEKYLQSCDSEVRKLIKIGIMEAGSGNYKAARENFRQAFLLDPTDEHILSLIQDLEKSSSILYFPQRIIERIGGPAVIWLGMVVTLLILLGLGLSKAAGIAAIIYIVICIYSWVVPLLYNVIAKRKN